MVGTAAAAIVVDTGTNDFRGAQDFRSSQSDAGLSALTAPEQDFGTQDFGGAQDFRSAESDAALSAAAPSGSEITSALQPGQTDSLLSPGNIDYSMGDPIKFLRASAPTSALQPGQTYSLVVPRAAAYDPAHEHLTSALGPTSAPQPGQTGW
jgi:hypothetical protein